MLKVWIKNIIAFLTFKFINYNGQYTIWGKLAAWRCIQVAKKNGKIFNKNNLPICCFRANGHVLEHEHADYPNYQFPITINLIDRKTNSIRKSYLLNEEEYHYLDDEHDCSRWAAFIGIKDNVIKVIYETCPGDFELETGVSINDKYLWENDDNCCWKICDIDLIKIKNWMKINEKIYS